MKISIEVQDFYLEEGDLLEASLKNYVKQNVLNEIWQSIKTKVDEQINSQIKATINTLVQEKIADYISEFILKGMVTPRYGKEANVSFVDYIKSQFDDASAIRDIKEQIGAQAALYAKQIKERYDLLFATQLVQKVHAAGLLKDEAAKLLFPPAPAV